MPSPGQLTPPAESSKTAGKFGALFRSKSAVDDKAAERAEAARTRGAPGAPAHAAASTADDAAAALEQTLLQDNDRRRMRSTFTLAAPEDLRRRAHSNFKPTDPPRPSAAPAAGAGSGVRPPANSRASNARGPSLVVEFPQGQPSSSVEGVPSGRESVAALQQSKSMSSHRPSAAPVHQLRHSTTTASVLHDKPRLSAITKAATAVTLADPSHQQADKRHSLAVRMDLDDEQQMEQRLVQGIKADADEAAQHEAAARQAVRAGPTSPKAASDSPAKDGPYKGLDPQVAAASVASLQKCKRLMSVYPLLPPNMRREEWSLHQFEFTKCLHNGYASKVYAATDRLSNEKVAVKVYDIRGLSELNRYQLLREIKLHSSLIHQNVVALYSAFQDGYYMVLVQEFCSGGNVLNLLRNYGGKLPESMAVKIVLQPLLSGLNYMHARGVTHRDIKPENLLLDGQGVLKMADFGLAINLTREKAVTRAGTTDYMAPEVLVCPLKGGPEDNKDLTQFHYGPTVDTWSVGVMAYELILGYPPFAAETKTQVIFNIQSRRIHFPKKKQISDEARSYIEESLELHPADRPTVQDMLHHRWIQTRQRRMSHDGSSSGSGSGQAKKPAAKAAAAPPLNPFAALSARFKAIDEFSAAAAQREAADKNSRAASAQLPPLNTTVANSSRRGAVLVPPKQAAMAPF